MAKGVFVSFGNPETVFSSGKSTSYSRKRHAPINFDTAPSSSVYNTPPQVIEDAGANYSPPRRRQLDFNQIRMSPPK